MWPSGWRSLPSSLHPPFLHYIRPSLWPSPVAAHPLLRTSGWRRACNIKPSSLHHPNSRMSLETRGARGLGFGVSNRNRVARASDCFRSCCSGFRRLRVARASDCFRNRVARASDGFRLSASCFPLSSLSAFGFRLWALRFSLHFRELGRRSCAPLSWPRPCSQPPSASRLPVFGVWARVSVSAFGFRILRRD